LDLSRLTTGAYVARFTPLADGQPLVGADKKAVAPAERDFFKEAGDPRAMEAQRGEIPITVEPFAAASTCGRSNVERQDPTGRWPIITGVPFPQGALWDPARVRLLDDRRREVPCQVAVNTRWSKWSGSIRWLGLDFQTSARNAEPTTYYLEFGKAVQRAPVPQPLEVTQDADRIAVHTGPLWLSVSKRSFGGIERAWQDVNGNGRPEPEELISDTTTAGGLYRPGVGLSVSEDLGAVLCAPSARRAGSADASRQQGVWLVYAGRRVPGVDHRLPQLLAELSQGAGG
jgi:hypothetical protein